MVISQGWGGGGVAPLISGIKIAAWPAHKKVPNVCPKEDQGLMSEVTLNSGAQTQWLLGKWSAG
jgi:hypothetical protein